MSFRLISRNEEKPIETNYIVNYKIHIETPETSLAKMYETKNEMIVTLEVPKSDYSNINIQRLLEWCKTPVYQKDYYRDLAVHLKIEEINERSIVFTHAKMTYETITDVKSDYVTIILTINQKLDRLSGVAFGIELEETYERAIKKANNPPLLNIYKEDANSNLQSMPFEEDNTGFHKNGTYNGFSGDYFVWFDGVKCDAKNIDDYSYVEINDAKKYMEILGYHVIINKDFVIDFKKTFKRSQFINIKNINLIKVRDLIDALKFVGIYKEDYIKNLYNETHIIINSLVKGKDTSTNKIEQLVNKVKSKLDKNSPFHMEYDKDKNILNINVSINYLNEKGNKQYNNPNDKTQTSPYTYNTLLEMGIEEKWSAEPTVIFGEFVCVHTKVYNKNSVNPKWEDASNQRWVDVEFYDYGDVCNNENNDNRGFSHVGNGWSRENPGTVRMFYSDDRTNSYYSVESFKQTSAHEFAHVFGYWDGYSDNKEKDKNGNEIFIESNFRPSIVENQWEFPAQGIDYEKIIAAWITGEAQVMRKDKNEKFSDIDKTFNDLIK